MEHRYLYGSQPLIWIIATDMDHSHIYGSQPETWITFPDIDHSYRHGSQPQILITATDMENVTYMDHSHRNGSHLQKQITATDMDQTAVVQFTRVYCNRHLIIHLEKEPNKLYIQRKSQISCKFGERVNLSVNLEKAKLAIKFRYFPSSLHTTWKMPDFKGKLASSPN